MSISEITLLLLTMMAGTWTPGPNNAMLSASGMRYGYRATQSHAWGIVFGHFFMMFTIAAGLGQIYQALPILDTILRVIAVVLMAYLAYKIASAPVETFARANEGAKPWTFWQAFFFQWINPKAWIIAIAISGLYVTGTDTIIRALIIAATAATAGASSSQGWTLFGVAMAQILYTPLRRRAFNLAMAAMILSSVVFLFIGDH